MSEVKEDEVRDLMDLGEFRDDEPFEWNPVEETEISEETTTEETQVETKIEEQTQTETSYWFSELNKSFGTNYSSVDELKSVLGEYGSLKEKVSKIDDFDTLSSRLEKVEKERNLLIEKYRELKDPQSFFADDVEFKRNQLIKSNPSINGEVARKALTMDLGTANPLDIIALSMQLTHSKLSGGEVGAKEAFLLSKGIDVQFEDDGSLDTSTLSRAQMNIINLEAEKAARDIVAVRDSIQMPEASKEVEDLINEWMAQKQELEFDTTQWSSNLDNLVNAVDVFSVIDQDGTIIYSEPIDDEYRKEIRGVAVDTAKQLRLDPTPENITVIIDGFKKDYVAENTVEVFKRYGKSIELKLKEDQHRQIHNDVDPDKSSTTTKVTTGRTTPLNRVLGIR